MIFICINIIPVIHKAGYSHLGSKKERYMHIFFFFSLDSMLGDISRKYQVVTPRRLRVAEKWKPGGVVIGDA